MNLSDTPYYHCVSRCVRRAFLCGKDHYTGQSYEHRRQWVEDRLLFLSTVFAIDVCAYAVMSNHTHVVLHVNQEQAKHWSDEEVLIRWHSVFKGTLLTQQYLHPTLQANMSEAERLTVQSTISVYRQRLYDISWYMRLLNEHIARQANHEDDCTGRFWEGRFKSQALLDETALAACMAYVDLNPIRANMAKTPHTSHHTSLPRRINDAHNGYQSTTLMPFTGSLHSSTPELPFHLEDYLQLVELTGKVIINASSPISLNTTPLLQHLAINDHQWCTLTTQFERHFKQAAGSEIHLQHYKHNHGLKRMPGIHSLKHT